MWSATFALYESKYHNYVFFLSSALDLDLDVGEQTVRWLYTNKIQLRKDTRFILGVMSCAFRFDLKGLCARLE